MLRRGPITNFIDRSISSLASINPMSYFTAFMMNWRCRHQHFMATVISTILTSRSTAKSASGDDRHGRSRRSLSITNRPIRVNRGRVYFLCRIPYKLNDGERCSMELQYLKDLWNDAETVGMDEPELLRYRSNLL